MNWIACLTIRHRRTRPQGRLLPGTIILMACTGCGAPTHGTAAPADPLSYGIEYQLRPNPEDGVVNVSLRVRQPRALLRELRFTVDSRMTGFVGDGELLSSEETLAWLPPANGGTLSWDVRVDSRRTGGGYDAYLGPEWGLFRAEDVIPRAAARTLRGASSETWLALALPQGWSAVTEYFGNSGRFRIDKPSRRFDQPSGWMVMGRLGIRRERIAGTRVAVAGPMGESVRRMDILALLHWTLPELARIVPALPARLTIVSAGEPMWRGALSGPQSLYVHAQRPLISENGTSTLLHELLHVSLAMTAVSGYDWILEGLAEYYSLELLRRTGSISAARHSKALNSLARWATQAETLCAPASTGATTALAVTVFRNMDREIQERSEGAASLDDVVRQLWHSSADIDLAHLSAVAGEIAGGKLDALHGDKLPGCPDIAGARQTN